MDMSLTNPLCALLAFAHYFRECRQYDYNSDRFFVQDGRGGRATCDLRKLAYRYRRIREVFGQRREGAMSPEVLAELKECYAATDKFTAGWLTLARTLLNKVSLIPGAVSVVVSACQLTPTLAKTMIYQLDEFVPAENIYAGSQIGKVRQSLGTEHLGYCLRALAYER